MVEQSGNRNKENEFDSSIGNISGEDKFSVSSILRRQRVSLGLSIEKISGDLRINKTYVQAIEDENFEAIPAEPYIRAYVKTIADFLSLDSEKLIKQLSEERSRKMGISLREDDSEDKIVEPKVPLNVSESRKNRSFGLIASLLLLLCVLLYFGINKNGLLQEPLQENYRDTLLGVISEEQNPEDSLSVLQSDFLDKDTLVAEIPEKVEMEFRVTKDSAWLEIFTDGVIFEKGRLIRTSPRTISVSADDSITIRVGNFFATDIQVNGKQVDKANATGYWRFTKDSIKVISDSEWKRLKRVFQ